MVTKATTIKKFVVKTFMMKGDLYRHPWLLFMNAYYQDWGGILIRNRTMILATLGVLLTFALLSSMQIITVLQGANAVDEKPSEKSAIPALAGTPSFVPSESPYVGGVPPSKFIVTPTPLIVTPSFVPSESPYAGDIPPWGFKVRGSAFPPSPSPAVSPTPPSTGIPGGTPTGVTTPTQAALFSKPTDFPGKKPSGIPSPSPSPSPSLTIPPPFPTPTKEVTPKGPFGAVSPRPSTFMIPTGTPVPTKQVTGLFASRVPLAGTFKPMPEGGPAGGVRR